MWKETHNTLHQIFIFTNFVEAFGFMTKVGLLAEKMNHHPEFKNTYNVVEITLSTHYEGDTITQKDRNLAAAIDKLL